MFHRHKWGEPSSVYTPGSNRSVKGRGPEAFRIAERVTLGVTNVTQRCIECGLVRSYSVTGRVDP